MADQNIPENVSCTSDCNSEEETVTETTNPLNGDKASDKEVQRKQKIQWNVKRDLLLLEQVEKVKPHVEKGSKAMEKWGTVANFISEACSIDVQNIAAKNRFNLLLNDAECLDSKKGYKSATISQLAELKNKLNQFHQTIPKSKGMKEAQLNKPLFESSEPVNEELDLQSNKRKLNRAESSNGVLNQVKDDQLKVKKPRLMTLDVNSGASPLNEPQQSINQTCGSENLEDKKLDQDIRLKQIQIKEKQLELDRIQFEHRKDVENQELKMKQNRFELEKEERMAMLSTQKLLMELFAKQFK